MCQWLYKYNLHTIPASLLYPPEWTVSNKSLGIVSFSFFLFFEKQKKQKTKTIMKKNTLPDQKKCCEANMFNRFSVLQPMKVVGLCDVKCQCKYIP